MKTKITFFFAAIAAMCLFTTNAQAQKISMTVADQHYAAEAGFYKVAMALLAFVYIVYMVAINYRRKEVKRYMGVNN